VELLPRRAWRYFHEGRGGSGVWEEVFGVANFICGRVLPCLRGADFPVLDRFGLVWVGFDQFLGLIFPF
jgi:hypothetical protein